MEIVHCVETRLTRIFEPEVGSEPWSVIAEDLDGDGDLDLAAVKLEHQITFRDLQPRHKTADVFYLIDFYFYGSLNWLYIRGVVPHVIPSRRIVEPSYLI